MPASRSREFGNRCNNPDALHFFWQPLLILILLEIRIRIKIRSRSRTTISPAAPSGLPPSRPQSPAAAARSRLSRNSRVCHQGWPFESGRSPGCPGAAVRAGSGGRPRPAGCRIERRTNDQGAVLEPNAEVVADGKEAMSPEVHCTRPQERLRERMEGISSNHAPGASALDGVEPFQGAAAAVKEARLVLRSQDKTGRKGPGAGLIGLRHWCDSGRSRRRTSGVPKPFEVVEGAAGQVRTRIDNAQRNGERHRGVGEQAVVLLGRLEARRGHGREIRGVVGHLAGDVAAFDEAPPVHQRAGRVRASPVAIRSASCSTGRRGPGRQRGGQDQWPREGRG